MARKIKIGDCFECIDGTGIWLAVADLYKPNWNYLEPITQSGSRSANHDRFEPLPTLHLPIGNSAKYGGAWFDMIKSGEKTEEYREFFGMDKGSPINIKTLVDWEKEDWQWLLRSFVERSEFMYDQIGFKPWNVLHLTNGYGHSKPQLWAHIESISIGRGNPEWGAPVDRDVFIIKLGKVFHTKNLKP